MPFFAWLALPLGLLAATTRADINPEIVSLGHDTYSLTRWATNGFTRKTDKIQTQALEDAAAYCAKLHKELKVLSTTADKPAVPLTGFASVKVVFKALDANDPELHAPVAVTIPGTATPMYVQPAAAPGYVQPAAAPAVAENAPPKTATDVLYSDLTKLDDLRKRGVLTEEEFQAQKKKLLEKSN
ncbi:MAG TPA: SHOCT domain-containing protein [Opitutaceae bacterium]|nr:SHOCT domain-containing protein [Opitutaceae bacterium]